MFNGKKSDLNKLVHNTLIKYWMLIAKMCGSEFEYPKVRNIALDIEQTIPSSYLTTCKGGESGGGESYIITCMISPLSHMRSSWTYGIIQVITNLPIYIFYR